MKIEEALFLTEKLRDGSLKNPLLSESPTVKATLCLYVAVQKMRRELPAALEAVGACLDAYRAQSALRELTPLEKEALKKCLVVCGVIAKLEGEPTLEDREPLPPVQ